MFLSDKTISGTKYKSRNLRLRKINYLLNFNKFENSEIPVQFLNQFREKNASPGCKRKNKENVD